MCHATDLLCIKIEYCMQRWLCRLRKCSSCLQLENIGNFVRAIQDYGLKPHDIFEANDLFENVNHTQVQCTLITLAGIVSELLHFYIDLLTFLSYFPSMYIVYSCRSVSFEHAHYKPNIFCMTMN